MCTLGHYRGNCIINQHPTGHFYMFVILFWLCWEVRWQCIHQISLNKAIAGYKPPEAMNSFCLTTHNMLCYSIRAHGDGAECSLSAYEVQLPQKRCLKATVRQHVVDGLQSCFLNPQADAPTRTCAIPQSSKLVPHNRVFHSRPARSLNPSITECLFTGCLHNVQSKTTDGFAGKKNMMESC